MKILFILGILAALTVLNLGLVSGRAAAASCNNPALTLWSRFYNVKIKSNKKYYIDPYTDNVIALYFLKKNKNTGIIKDYILWYFKHLNYPDKFGLTGTMYDYIISKSGCIERPANTYDSADSYAATYIMAVYKYYKKTKDIKMLKYISSKLKDVAYIIPYLQTSNNGLIKALPDKDEEYLMDNCEDYGGVKAYLGLLEITGEKSGKEFNYYEKLKKSIKAAIIKNLYNRRRNNFDWAIIKGRKRYSNWLVYYPDALAQLFPILYGITDQSTVSAKFLWNKFKSIYRKKTGPFPAEQKALYFLTKEKINK
ncbi:MAG: hypothetical protein EVJ47_00490 [Candidatus Acidulodesulfobacterium ferriphilum]|uniref:Cellulase n=1 Tax=Candidatus Acidulodesulfobacterium ferriphilum TaxID=2597223 RepID=A0A519BBZ9_9DELT|nr:MAG: hypothetical protein EVJ47_00490 [Candidatus Acidulodesulfobacterium ferriphilum]